MHDKVQHLKWILQWLQRSIQHNRYCINESTLALIFFLYIYDTVNCIGCHVDLIYNDLT